MKFPDWAEDPNLSDKERASARLKYLMLSIATEKTGKGSLRAFARLTGIDHSTLAYSIKRGSCTPGVATRIEDVLGRDCIRNEHLRNPLEIEST